MKLTAFILLLSLSASALAEPLADIFERQRFETESIERASDTEFSENDLKEIEYIVLFNNQPSQFRNLIFYTWKKLSEQKKVRMLTQDLRDQLGIPKLYCSDEVRCSELVAVYLPASNYLLIDAASVTPETRGWFFHELVHAVQYTYRLPLDLDYLYTKVKPEILFDYLRFFYEAQANWYSMRNTDKSEWLKVRQNKVISGVQIGGKILAGLLTLGGTLTLKGFFEDLLPDIDKTSGSKQIKQRDLDFNELVMLKQIHNINLGTQVDMNFHEAFTRAIEKSYFGHLDFLHQKDNGDQKIFRELHNRFYKTFDVSMKTCSPLLDAVQEGSPLLNWLTNKNLDYRSCNHYLLPTFFENRDILIHLFESANGIAPLGGTKGGGGPGLRIRPEIQPQLLVFPEGE